MNQYIEFVMHHWMLWSLFFLVIIVIIYEEIRGRIQGVARIQPADLISFINKDDAIVIDVRDSNAFIRGHIIGAVNIPHTQMDSSIDKIKKYQGKPIVLVCAAGQTSPQEGAKLKKKGIDQVYFLSGGINAWQQAQLPLTKD